MRRTTALILVVLSSIASFGAFTWAVYAFTKHEQAAKLARQYRPRIMVTRPAAGATGVLPITGVGADIYIPSGAGVDPATLAAGVKLVRVRDGGVVDALANTTGSGDAVVLKPVADLDADTEYAFEVSPALRDTAGHSFAAFRSTFTTAAAYKPDVFPAAFEKVDLGVRMEMGAFTCLTIGPDGDLYAGSSSGMVYRYGINPDGVLEEKSPSSALLRQYRGPRLITGICFDPQGNLYVNHGQLAVTPQGKMEGADDWTGALSKLSAPELSQCADVLVGLPRAYKDHLNFQMAFGPDGALYFTQGSHTSDGSPDAKWGYRPERKLSAAMLRLDIAKLKTLPLDVKTEDGGAYDPAAKDAPLTVYATGIRSGFDVLWHSNGHLYTAVNGAAGGGGMSPASPDGKTPALENIKTTVDDVLLDVRAGKYYGQPNPTRGEFALHGGNPTAGVDVQEIREYPVGTRPDARYAPPAFVFGKNYSCNGLIEYPALPGSSGNALAGCILTTRYSDGDDVLALRLDAEGRVVESIAHLDGLTQFTDPLDLTVDARTGNLYVAEYAGRSIVLVRPIPGGVSQQAVLTPAPR